MTNILLAWCQKYKFLVIFIYVFFIAFDYFYHIMNNFLTKHEMYYDLPSFHIVN